MATTENEGPGPRDPGRILNGVIWAVVSMVLFTITPVLVRQLGTDMTPVEIIFHRSVISAVGIGAFFLWRDIGGLRTRVLRIHLARSFINLVAIATWFQAILMMPLTEATALHFTLPLFTVILAALFLSEQVGWRRWCATIIGFLGVLIVLRPGIVEVGLPEFLVLASALFYAGAVIFIKHLTKTDGALAIAFYANVFMALIAAIPVIFLWRGPSLDEVPLLFLMAAVGTAAPYCLTRALHLLEASLVAPMDFLRLPFTAVAAWLVFAEIPDNWTWVGAGVIFGATSYIARREARLARSNGSAGTGRR